MTILETITIFEQPGAYIPLFFTFLICNLIFFFIAGISYTNHFDTTGLVFTIMAIISIIFFLISLALTITEPKVDTGRKQYIIRVDENTSINEIYENYKIIDHTKYTDVYTVEELEND